MIGQVVDGHEIVRSLGAGGMGEVYLARAQSGALRAFKIVRADRATTQTIARFRREALALGRLQHPGIVRILDAGQLPGGAVYLGIEYVEGRDLQAAVTEQGPLALADALRLVAQLAEALAYAHAQGVVHRDLKPANVLLADRAKIIDFGLAKIIADEGLTRLTEDQQVLGSPLYWAPEQSTSAQVGPPADIYALGGIAYFALSGQPLFRPRPAVALVYAHAHEAPEPLAARCSSIELPPALEDLVHACVAKVPAQRPTAAIVAYELDRILATLPSTQGHRKSAPRLFTHTGVSDLGQALTSQIRQVLLDLAATLALATDDIDRLQNELSERELELAMLESEVEVTIDPEPEIKRTAMQATVAELQAHLADAFRGLLDRVTLARPHAPEDATALYAELDELLARYEAP